MVAAVVDAAGRNALAGRHISRARLEGLGRYSLGALPRQGVPLKEPHCACLKPLSQLMTLRIMLKPQTRFCLFGAVPETTACCLAPLPE